MKKRFLIILFGCLSLIAIFLVSFFVYNPADLKLQGIELSSIDEFQNIPFPNKPFISELLAYSPTGLKDISYEIHPYQRYAIISGKIAEPEFLQWALANSLTFNQLKMDSFLDPRAKLRYIQNPLHYKIVKPAPVKGMIEVDLYYSPTQQLYMLQYILSRSARTTDMKLEGRQDMERTK